MRQKTPTRVCLFLLCPILLGCAMGIPTPPPPIVGTLCIRCDGVCWPAGATPRFIHVTFRNLERCPLATQDPPNGTYVLEQDAVDPCLWVYVGGGFRIFVQITAEVTHVGVTGPPPEHYPHYFSSFAPDCPSDFDNHYTICYAQVVAKNGTAHVDWW